MLKDAAEVITGTLSGILFVVFLAGKVTGILAAWSWWWVLMPAVPVAAVYLGWA